MARNPKLALEHIKVEHAMLPAYLRKQTFGELLKDMPVGGLIELSAYFQNKAQLVKEEIERRALEEYG